MKSIIVAADNFEIVHGGRMTLGRQEFGCRGGSYETYQVRLSASASAHVEVGDTINFWDGRSELPSIDCGGEIVKADGSRIQLDGCRDVGIDTGHPTHLGLKMQTRKGLTWEWDFDGVIPRAPSHVVRAPWGTWYRFDHCPPGIWGVESHEQMLEFATNCEVFDGKTQPLSKTQRLRLTVGNEDNMGWIHGSLTPEVKCVGEVSTDKPLILF